MWSGGVGGTPPQSPHHLPPVPRPFTERTVDAAAPRTSESSVTVTLPQICRFRSNSTRTSADVSSARLLAPLPEAKPTPQKRNIPSYNVRTVVRREDHPLWSHSIRVQFQYLFGKHTSQVHCSPSDNYRANMRHSELSKDQEYRTFGATECSERAVERNGHSVVNEGTVMKLTVPKKIAIGVLKPDAAARRKEFAEGEQSLEQDQPMEKWVYLGPREFATLFPLLLRDECLARQAIVEEERYEAFRTLPLPPRTSRETLHPALIAGCTEICLMEEILRRVLLAEENDAIAPLWDLYVYEHRCLVMGTAPLKKFVRNWLWLHRGRKMRQHACLERVFTQEAKSRCEITMEWWEEQRQLFTTLTATMEQLYRTVIERMQLCAQYAHGVASIWMQERVECFPLLYGEVMSKTLVCGRISGFTLFKQLDLLQEYHRLNMTKLEEGERIGISCMMLRDELVRFTEVEERLQLVSGEATACTQLRFRLLAAKERCHRREWEIVEACERQISLGPVIQSLLVSAEEQTIEGVIIPGEEHQGEEQ